MPSKKKVGRINHHDHDHPSTSWWNKACRDQVIRTGEPFVMPNGFEFVHDGESYVWHGTAYSPSEVDLTTPNLVPVQVEQSGFIWVSDLGEVVENLVRVSDTLCSVGSLQDAKITLSIGGASVRAEYIDRDWKVSVQ